jgi:hypothetical protein
MISKQAKGFFFALFIHALISHTSTAQQNIDSNSQRLMKKRKGKHGGCSDNFLTLDSSAGGAVITRNKGGRHGHHGKLYEPLSPSPPTNFFGKGKGYGGGKSKSSKTVAPALAPVYPPAAPT